MNTVLIAELVDRFGEPIDRLPLFCQVSFLAQLTPAKDGTGEHT
jgi:hypothetical protein